jgi:hypothetical protein
MNNFPLSAWRTAYASAVFETDQGRMSTRISEALAAIQQRLQTPSEIGAIEHKSIEAARMSLAQLERANAVPRATAATSGSK